MNSDGSAWKSNNALAQFEFSTCSVRSGASEIASGNADLSKRTEAQASSLEDAVSNMEDMASVVKHDA